MASCPCCGSQVERPVLVSLDTNEVSTALGSLRVEPQCAEMVAALLGSYPDALSLRKLGFAIWGERCYDFPDSTLRKRVWEYRRAIRPLGLMIENCFGFGYRLRFGG